MLTYFPTEADAVRFENEGVVGAMTLDGLTGRWFLHQRPMKDAFGVFDGIKVSPADEVASMMVRFQ